MAEEEKIALLIEALLSNESVKKFVEDARKAGEDAAHGLNDGGKGKPNPFKEQSEALGDLKGQIGGMITQYVALSAAISYVGDSFHKALQEEKVNSQIIGNMQALTGATLEQAQATVQMLDAAELASGIDKDRLAPALNEVAASTENLEQAQEAVRISAGAAARGLGTLEGNARILAVALETGVIPKKQAFGKVLLNLKEKTGSLDGAIREMNKTYGDAGAAVDTNAMKMDRSKIQWDNAKEAIGGMVQGIVMSLMPALKWVAMSIAGVIGVVKLLGSAFMAQFKIAKMFGEMMVKVFKGDFAGAAKVGQDSVNEMAESFMADLQAVGDSIDAVSNSFDKMTAKVGGEAGGTFKPKHGKKEKGDEAVTKVNLGSADLGNMGGESIMDKMLRQDEEVIESKRKTYELMSKSDEEYNEHLLEILTERAALYEEGSDKQIEILITKKNLEAKIEKDATAKKKKADDDFTRTLQTSSRKELVELKKFYEADVKLHAKGTAAKKKAEQALAAVKKQLNKMTMKDSLAAASQGVALAQKAFGESKELSIASAFINMFESITGVWKQWSAYPPVAAALIALSVAGTMAEIQNIQKTDPSKGSGFDDPQNDIAAEIGGARWAKDFTNKFGKKAMAGMSDELGGGEGNTPIYNYHQYQPGQVNKTTNVNVSAVPLIDTSKDHMMRELASGIRTYVDLDSERDVK